MEVKASTSIREQVIFLSYKGRSFDLNLKHGHTWKLRENVSIQYYIYKFKGGFRWEN